MTEEKNTIYKEETCPACRIEHQAVLFALMAKRAIEAAGEKGREVVLEGMDRYGNERGARMAKNAKSNGDELTVANEQAYGEWKPDYDGQMVFGTRRGEPTLQTYISKCAWCEAWKKHGLLEYGKLYCVNVDNAVFQGFNPDFRCDHVGDSMSWGGDECVFDWNAPLTKSELDDLAAKKKELGTRFMKDFNFHTAHIYRAVGDTIREKLGAQGDEIVDAALKDFEELYGKELLQTVLDTAEKETF